MPCTNANMSCLSAGGQRARCNSHKVLHFPCVKRVPLTEQRITEWQDKDNTVQTISGSLPNSSVYFKTLASSALTLHQSTGDRLNWEGHSQCQYGDNKQAKSLWGKTSSSSQQSFPGQSRPPHARQMPWETRVFLSWIISGHRRQ